MTVFEKNCGTCRFGRFTLKMNKGICAYSIIKSSGLPKPTAPVDYCDKWEVKASLKEDYAKDH